MLRSPGKQFGSNPELANPSYHSDETGHVALRKRKRDEDFSDCFKQFSEEIKATLSTWKIDIEKDLSLINSNLNNIIKNDLAKLNESSQEMKAEINSIRKDYAAVNTSIKNLDLKFNNLKADVSSLQQSTQFISDQHDDVMKKMDSLDLKKIDKMESELEEMRNQNKLLKLEINTNDQRERSQNLEIIGIPEFKDENLHEIIMNIAKNANVVLSQNDILQVNRVTPRTKVQGRPRVIIAKMSARILRDNIIAGCRKGRLSTGSLGIPGEKKPVFINEHLTFFNKQLLKMCKDTAKLKNYQHVWIKNGRISVRKNDSSPVIRIFSEDDVKKIV